MIFTAKELWYEYFRPSDSFEEIDIFSGEDSILKLQRIYTKVCTKQAASLMASRVFDYKDKA